MSNTTTHRSPRVVVAARRSPLLDEAAIRLPLLVTDDGTVRRWWAAGGMVHAHERCAQGADAWEMESVYLPLPVGVRSPWATLGDGPVDATVHELFRVLRARPCRCAVSSTSDLMGTVDALELAAVVISASTEPAKVDWFQVWMTLRSLLGDRCDRVPPTALEALDLLAPLQRSDIELFVAASEVPVAQLSREQAAVLLGEVAAADRRPLIDGVGGAASRDGRPVVLFGSSPSPFTTMLLRACSIRGDRPASGAPFAVVVPLWLAEHIVGHRDLADGKEVVAADRVPDADTLSAARVLWESGLAGRVALDTAFAVTA